MAEIPCIIHYCWFGGSSLGAKEERCIESWRRLLPGYEIRRWDETNFNVRCCTYVSEAYDAKMWAFVSDYARFKILYEEGGLYFDTDVEMVSSLDDIIAGGPFMGVESFEPQPGIDCGNFVPTVNPGLGLASQPGSDLFQEILESYEHDHFLLDDGTYNLTTVVTRTTEILRSHGWAGGEGVQSVAGVDIYPADFFNPKDFLTGKIRLTKNTCTVHHFSMSWYTPAQKAEKYAEEALLKRGLSYGFAHFIAKWYATIRYLDFARLGRKVKKMAHGR